MHLDFRTHKRSKKFPFYLLGVLFLASFLFLIIYFYNEKVSLELLINKSTNKIYLDIFYFTFIIINLIQFIFSISIIMKLRSLLKFLLSISLLGYSLFGMITGYFYNTDFFIKSLHLYFLFALLYFFFYIITFVFQNNTFSTYNNIIVFVISSLPFLPLAIINYGLFKQIALTQKFMIVSNYVYIVSLLICVLINSIYLYKLNRKF